MKSYKLTLAAVLAIVSATGALATNYSLWIHGMALVNPSEAAGRIGQYRNSGAFGARLPPDGAGVNDRYANWAGGDRIAEQNGNVREAMDRYCTGNNWCYIGAHSAGNVQLGYALSMYGSTPRNIYDVSSRNNEDHFSYTGRQQTGWNIKWALIASGAAGGSELNDWGIPISGAVVDAMFGTSNANLPSLLGRGILNDLKTTTARVMYDHNNTRGKWFYMYAGAKGGPQSLLMLGRDDGAVAYHSTGGVSGASGRRLCNPEDWLCSNLSFGSGPNQLGETKWNNHYVQFRDDAKKYGHGNKGNWEGIVSVVARDMAAWAH